MWYLVALLLVSSVNSQENNTTDYERTFQGFNYPIGGHQRSCMRDHQIVAAYRAAYDAFNVKLFQNAGPKSQYFCILAPYTIWLTLAAIAEGSDYYTQKEIFKVLGLPQDRCSREKFYQVATTRLSSTTYARETKAMVIDERVALNPQWHTLVYQHSLLRIFTAPIKRDPITATRLIQRIVPTGENRLDLNGNSVLLNSMDFNSFWSTAFAGAVIERSPFYSRTGVRIGSVDLMRIKKRVKIGYAPGINSKILEIPLGIDGKYSIMFGLVVDDDADLEPAIRNATDYTFSEVISSLRDSYFPVDIAIPRLSMDTEIDMRDLMEDLGIVNLWKNPWATSPISSPPAHPTSFIQRATLTLDSYSVTTAPYSGTRAHAATEERYWSEFIADRPFMFALVDTDTYTCLMATMCAKPTYLD